MVKIILIRGAPAVGKTTVTKEILKKLKLEKKLNCAYICEDDFRKQMQFKYKAKDIQVHKNSFKLIKKVLLELLKLDNYDFVFIEGQFRYKNILENYSKFFKSKKFDFKVFQFNLDLKEMRRRDIGLRDTKSKDIIEVKKDIDAFTLNDTIFIDSNKSINSVVRSVISKL